MNRIDFMNQLERLLQNISSGEREEALQYYNEYFNDAGEENEQAVIEALGNPAKVAENIKRDIFGNGYGDISYQKNTASERAVAEYQGTNEKGKDGSAAAEHMEPESGKKMSPGMVALIVVLCILASPVILGLLSAILGVIGGLVATWFSLILGFGITAVVLLAMLIILLISGIAGLFSSPLIGLGLIGAGFLCGGIGILFLMLTVAMAGIATPAIIRGCVSLCRKLFRKIK